MEKSAEQWFAPADRAGHEESIAPTGFVISSLCIRNRGGHSHVQIWSRGGIAGELVLNAGDGQFLVTALGLRPSIRPPW